MGAHSAHCSRVTILMLPCCVCSAFGRELQKWAPDEGDDGSLFLGLEESAGGWDQFAVNKEKFGVESTFDEHIYTTKINKDNCVISEADAARIAREIESGAALSTNVHILEERGMEVDDDGVSCILAWMP